MKMLLYNAERNCRDLSCCGFGSSTHPVFIYCRHIYKSVHLREGCTFGSHVQINRSWPLLLPSQRCAIPIGYTVTETIPSEMLANFTSLEIVLLMYLLCACVYGATASEFLHMSLRNSLPMELNSNDRRVDPPNPASS